MFEEVASDCPVAQVAKDSEQAPPAAGLAVRSDSRHLPTSALVPVWNPCSCLMYPSYRFPPLEVASSRVATLLRGVLADCSDHLLRSSLNFDA